MFKKLVNNNLYFVNKEIILAVLLLKNCLKIKIVIRSWIVTQGEKIMIVTHHHNKWSWRDQGSWCFETVLCKSWWRSLDSIHRLAQMLPSFCILSLHLYKSVCLPEPSASKNYRFPSGRSTHPCMWPDRSEACPDRPCFQKSPDPCTSLCSTAGLLRMFLTLTQSSTCS